MARVQIASCFLFLVGAAQGSQFSLPPGKPKLENENIQKTWMSDIKEAGLRKYGATMDNGKLKNGWRRELAQLNEQDQDIRKKKDDLKKQRAAEEKLLDEQKLLAAQDTYIQNLDKRDQIIERLENIGRRMEKLNAETDFVWKRKRLLESRWRDVHKMEKEAEKKLWDQRTQEHQEELKAQVEQKEHMAKVAEDEYKARIAEAEARRVADEEAMQERKRLAREDAMKATEDKAERIFEARNRAEEELENNEKRKARVWAARRAKEEAERHKEELLSEHDAKTDFNESLSPEQSVVKEADHKLKSVFFNMISDYSMSDMMEMLEGLRKASMDTSFVSNVSQASFEFQLLSAQYVRGAKAMVARFSSEVANSTREEFVPKLAHFFDEYVQLLKGHQQNATRISDRVYKRMPFKLKKYGGHLMDSMVPQLEPIHFDALKLAQTPINDACDQVSQIMANVSRYEDLSSVREAINATTRAIPSLSLLMPDLTPEVTELVSTASSVGYVEATVFEEASKDIVEHIGPVIINRLHCTWSSDSSHSMLGAIVAGLAAVQMLL